MPYKLISILVRFLEQNNGAISKRDMEKEFNMLTPEEIKKIESDYSASFLNI